MEALLTTIILWLSINYDLPAGDTLPAVRLADPAQIAFLHYQAFDASSQARVLAMNGALPLAERRVVVSVYDARRDEILLPYGWTPRKVADLSALVHEAMHHLQARANLKYPCPQEREKLAYEAQEKWLGQFGTSLEREFQIDGLTLLASTTCGM